MFTAAPPRNRRSSLSNRILILLVLCGIAASASAQSDFSRYNFTAGGGLGIGRGEVAAFVGNSGHAVLGGGMNFNKMFGVDAEYMFYNLSFRPSVIQGQNLNGASGHMQSISLEDCSGLEFNRPPRLLPPGQVIGFTLPSPPGKPERRPVPVLMAVVPIVLGVAMAYFLRQVYMLAMAAFSPVMLLGSYVSDRRHGRKSHARQQAGYREHKARVERDARDAVGADRLRRRHDSPDPATVLSIASGPRRRLWERRRTDPDYLLLRVGTADLPSAVELTDPTADEHRRRRFWLIPDAPLTI